MVEIDDYVPARRYLAPRTASLWRWDDATAEAVVWTEGGTVAFREELLPVLARLAKRGLPPMNALVWLLGACRESWPGTANNLISQASGLASIDRCDLPPWLPQLMAQLDAVHRLPAELRTLPAAKAELAAMVFEESRPEVGPEDSYRIVRMLAECHEPGLMASQPGRQNRFSDVLAELERLHEGLKRFDAAEFRLRFQTGLEQPVEAAEVDLEPAERAAVDRPLAGRRGTGRPGPHRPADDGRDPSAAGDFRSRRPARGRRFRHQQSRSHGSPAAERTGP